MPTEARHRATLHIDADAANVLLLAAQQNYPYATCSDIDFDLAIAPHQSVRASILRFD